MDFLINLRAEELIALSNVISANLEKNYNITELAIIANFFMLLGENLEAFLRVRANDEFLRNGETNFDTTDQ